MLMCSCDFSGRTVYAPELRYKRRVLFSFGCGDCVDYFSVLSVGCHVLFV